MIPKRRDLHIAMCVWVALLSAADGKKTPAAPTAGVKTPGVQIPFANLKAELEFTAPGNPEWLAFAGSVFIPEGGALARIDPKAKEMKFLEPIAELNKPCGGVVNAFGALWAPLCGDKSLARIDPKTAKVTDRLAFGAGPIAASTDSIWVFSDSKTTLTRIDPVQKEAVSEVRLPAGCAALAFGEGALWAACPTENKIIRISPVTSLIEKSIEVSGQPKSLAIGEGSVWVLCQKDGKIDRIDPKLNKVAKTIDLAVPGVSGAMAFGEGSLWITQTGFPLTRVHPQNETVVQQF